MVYQSLSISKELSFASFASFVHPLTSSYLCRLGLEGLITFKGEIEYDAESYRVTVPSPTGKRTVTVFDKIKVKISVEKDRNTHRGKVRMDLA